MCNFSKIKMFLVLVLTILVSQAQASSGGMDAGGGDIVRCKGTLEELNGSFALDYALMIGRGNSLAELDPKVKDWNIFETYLLAILEEKAPKLKPSFDDFAQSTQQIRFCGYFPCDNFSAFSRSYRVWSGAQLKLNNLPDEGNLLRLPKECKRQLSDTSPALIVQAMQAVIRHQMGKRIVYNYGGILKSIWKQPYQLSFLLVHEWLRDYTQDPEVIRNVTWFLHSKEAFELSADEFTGRLNSLGLRY